MFDVFRQAESGKSRRHGGMGIGLALVRQLTELHGGTVKAFSKGVGRGEGLRIAMDQEFDVVLSDISMREMDGYEFLKKFRSGSKKPAASAVALTGFGREEDVREARCAGFDEHLTKPVRFEELVGVIRATIDGPPQPRTRRRVEI